LHKATIINHRAKQSVTEYQHEKSAAERAKTRPTCHSHGNKVIALVVFANAVVVRQLEHKMVNLVAVSATIASVGW
jgi:hypothetical protein